MIEDVKKYYDDSAEIEWNRLNNPYSKIEFKTTIHLFQKYFPSRGHILDIGCGPGRYSIELLKRGYKVSLLDISVNELNIAREKIKEANLKAEEYYCKSAMELGHFHDDTFEGILLMGPLYHLHNKEDRMLVLKETHRILKKNGIALISYINTWGALKAGVSEFPESFRDIQHFQRYIDGNLKFSPEESFTCTFFTTPPLALKEIRQSGFEIISYAGAESFLSGLNTQVMDLHKNLPEVYKNYLDIAPKYCELPQYRDATEHLHIIVKKR